MSSKRILRSVLVAVVAVGLVVGPAGAAAAAPERGEGRLGEWTGSLGKLVTIVWSWVLSDSEEQPKPQDDATPEANAACEGSTQGCGDAQGGMDPNG